MASLGLFRRSLLWDLIGLISRYLVHPSTWVREAAAQFVEQAARFLSPADQHCVMQPLLHPFLKTAILEFSEASILDKLKVPLARPVFDAAVLWAAKRSKSLFWTAASRDRTFVVAQSEASIVASNSKRFLNRIPPSQKDKDDTQALDTLRNFGFTTDDEVKLLALREYILKFSQHKSDDNAGNTGKILNTIVSLAQLDITPQSVFFDTAQPYRPATRQATGQRLVGRENAKTIADALMDASVSIDPDPATNTETRTGSRRSDVQKDAASNTIAIRSSSNEQTRTDAAAGGIDRPNLRIEEIKGGSVKRSSSVGGRHALLDKDRLSAEHRDPKHLVHRNSSINLLGRTETIKADAELSTTQENAFGKIDRSPTDHSNAHEYALTRSLNVARKSRSKSPMSQGSEQAAFEANHTYTGNEPAVIRLLDNHVSDKFPIDLLDFGAPRKASEVEVAIKSATTIGQQPGQNAVTPLSGNKEAWRPSGLLLAQFLEHTAAINRVVAAPDHAFFVTASDDGTCRIWDSTRLEKNVSARSRYAHRHAEGEKVKALCFIEDTHTFISGATDGAIHAVRVDVKSAGGNEPTKFSKPVLVRDWLIPQQGGQTGMMEDSRIHEHAVWIHHYREQNSQSILLVATSLCRVLMVDMKNMEVVRAMQNPFHHGTLTTFCVDKKHHWIMLGTSHGVLDLWDLRFKLRLRSFGIGGAGIGCRVDRLLLHPTRGHGKWVVASCGGEISIWDIEKLTCREVLRPSTFAYDDMRKGRHYEPWLPDEEQSEAMLERFVPQLKVDDTILQPVITSNGADNLKTGHANINGAATASTQIHGPAITSLLIFHDYLVNNKQPENPNKTALMLSVGEDRTLRYWNFGHIEQSSIVSGPMINIVGEENRTKPRYETSWPTSMSLSGLVQLVEEKLSDTSPGDGRETLGSARNTPRKKRDMAVHSSKQGGDVSKVNANSKTPRNTIISAAQEQMLRTHMDDITDVCLLRRPYGCIVSVDRSGAIFVMH